MPNPGALRFNTDSLKLELFDGNQWTEIVATSPEAQTGGARGLFGGGTLYPATFYNIIDYVTIPTTGNALDFGDLGGAYSWFGASFASRTRGVWAGYQVAASPYTAINVIQYVTISSTGDTQDFGDLYLASIGGVTSGVSNSTRGLVAGGDTTGSGAYTNTIQYLTIASTGDSKDFGDLTRTRYATSCVQSSTRGVFGGTAPAYVNDIDFVTISTLGNAADFGDLTAGSANGSGCSNSTRGLFTLGLTPVNNSINYITISTLGNAVDFGDTTTARFYGSSVSSPTRGLYAGGADSPASDYNIIDYVSIMSTGNAVDFGDLITARRGLGGLSNGHGGL